MTVERTTDDRGRDVDLNGNFNDDEQKSLLADDSPPTSPASPAIEKEQSPRVTRTLKVLQSKLPGKKINIFSEQGSSAILYEVSDDNSGAIYKVASETKFSDYFDREAKKIKMLADTGAGPKLTGFYPLEIGDESKKLKEAMGRFEETTPIDEVKVLVLGESELPIIVMGKVNIDKKGLAELNKSEIESKARELALLISRSKLMPGDSEVVLEAETGKLMLIDAGGCRYDEDSSPERVYEWIIDDLMCRPTIKRILLDAGLEK